MSQCLPDRNTTPRRDCFDRPGLASGLPLHAMNRPSPLPSPSPRRLAITVRGVVQGVGFRPFVYNAARACGLAGWVLQRGRHGADRGAGRRGCAWMRSSTRLRAAIRRRPASTPSKSRKCRPSGGRLATCRASFEIRASDRHVGAAADDPRRSGHVPRVPGRNPRSVAAPLPLSVHQLHQLRPAVVDHRAVALRPAADLDGRVSRCARTAGPSTTIRPTGVFTPSRSPARAAGRRCNCSTAEGREMAAGEAALAAAAQAAVGRPHRGHEGLGRISTAGRCDQRRGGRPAARAKTAARPAVCPDAAVAG